MRFLSTSCRFLPPAHILCQHSSFYYPRVSSLGFTFSFPIFLFSRPFLYAYLSCSPLFSTDSSFIATIRLFYRCPASSLTSPFVIPLSPRFPSDSFLITTIWLFITQLITSLAVAPVTFFFAHLLVLPHLLGYFLSHPFGCYYLLFISTRTVFFCPYLILLISSLSLSFFLSAFFLPAHLLSQPLIVIIPSLVTSFILAFCSFPFLLPGGPRRFIFSCLAHLSRFLFLSLRIFLPAHFLSQLFGCYYC